MHINMMKLLKDIFSNANRENRDKEEDFIHKEIVETFFKKSIHDVPHKKTFEINRKTAIIALVALFSALVLSPIIIILYRKSVDSLGEKSALTEIYYSKKIIKNGRINHSDIEETFLDGDAKAKSSFLKVSIKLVNSGPAGRAALVMRFREPLDLEDKHLLVTARAQNGTKKAKIILKNSKNRFYEFADMSFSSNWNMNNIFTGKKHDFDLKSIKELKFEFGSNTAGNKEDSILYLKDLTVRGPR